MELKLYNLLCLSLIWILCTLNIPFQYTILLFRQLKVYKAPSFLSIQAQESPFKMKILKYNRKLDEKNLYKLIFFLECFIETRYPKLSSNSLFSQQNGLNMLILNMELSYCEAPISFLYNITLCYIECNSCQMP